MRFRSFRYCLVSCLTLATYSHAARAEHSVANFPDDAPRVAFAPALPVTTTPAPQSPTLPAPPPPGGGTAAPTASDSDALRAERRRKEWLLSLEGVTHAPVDVGVQLGLETPQRLRLFGGLGWVPSGYMGLLTGIAANGSGNSYARALLEHGEYTGNTWHIQAGWRPFRSLGLYGDIGYARVNATGALDLASSGVPQLAMFGGGYVAKTQLDMWLIELGYQGELADRLVLGLALGVMGTFNSTTRINAVDGAPSNNAILTSAATQADTALEKYGYVPTLSLRLGFDLI
jgi:hypothetical protein